MSERPRRRWVYWLGGILAVVLVVCGGATYLLWGLVQGITGLFVTPPNPTNEPDVVHTFPGPGPADLTFSPDGKLLAVVSPLWREIDVAAPAATTPADPPTLTVYDVTTGAKVHSATLARWPRTVAFAPDGKHLAVGMGSSVTKVEGDEKAELVVYAVPGFAEKYRGRPGPDCHPDHLEFAPDSSLLFAFRTDDFGGAQAVTAWRFPILTAGPTLKVAMQRPECATVAADGIIIVGGRTKDYTAAGERFDRAGTPLGPLKYAPAQTGAVIRLAATGKVVTAISTLGAQDFDPATGEPVSTPAISPNVLDSVTVVAADGSRGATSYKVADPGMAPDFRPWYQKGGFVRVVSRTGGAGREWRVGVYPTPIAFTADGKLIAAGVNDTAAGGSTGVKVWVSP